MSAKLLILSALFLGACGSTASTTTPTPDSTGRADSERALRYDTVLTGTPANLTVDVKEGLASACNIPADTTFFNYGTATLDAQDKTVLVMVADCLQNGALKGRSIILTGFADFTGGYTYNEELGLQRSRAVADELLRLGVASDRLFVRTSGERGASYPGVEAVDRKVELRLVNAQEDI